MLSDQEDRIITTSTETSDPQPNDPLPLESISLLAEKSNDNNKPIYYAPSENKEKWRCACDGGFLPPSLLKSFGGMESAVRLGLGQCYHKS